MNEFGFAPLVEQNENPHDYYIPENIFYRLCMKAKNEFNLVKILIRLKSKTITGVVTKPLSTILTSSTNSRWCASTLRS